LGFNPSKLPNHDGKPIFHQPKPWWNSFFSARLGNSPLDVWRYFGISNIWDGPQFTDGEIPGYLFAEAHFFF